MDRRYGRGKRAVCAVLLPVLVGAGWAGRGVTAEGASSSASGALATLLSPQNGTMVIGAAAVLPPMGGIAVPVSASSAGAATIAVQLDGLKPAQRYRVGIYGSSCSATGTPPGTSPGKAPRYSRMLPVVRADAQGLAMEIASVAASGAPTGTLAVHVLEDTQRARPLSCGVLHTAGTVVRLTDVSGSRVSGAALITTGVPVLAGRDAHGMEVIVYATGLQRNTVQPNHIHAGACGSGGPVLFPLNTLVTDGAGRAIAGTGIPYTGRVNGDSVHIHGTDFKMAACGTIGIAGQAGSGTQSSTTGTPMATGSASPVATGSTTPLGAVETASAQRSANPSRTGTPTR